MVVSKEKLDSMRKYFTFKQEKEITHLMLLHPSLMLMFADFSNWAYKQMLPVEITRCIDEKIPGVSVSNTHIEGRAIDISVRGWGADQILAAVDYISEKYNHVGAISASDLQSKPIVYHNAGRGDHLHLQIRRDL